MPYFVSSEVHGHPVERVQFFGDTIISHAASEEYVQQWRIAGFKSDIPEEGLPTKPSFLEEEARTRSAWQFTDSPHQPMYERLLRFEVPVQEEDECGKDGKIIKKSELREDGLLKDLWHQRRQYVDFDLCFPHQRLGAGRDHRHATFVVAKLNEVRFWDFTRLLHWTESKEQGEPRTKCKLPWEEQLKPEKKPARQAIMSEKQTQRLEAAWKNKRSKEEASLPRSTSTKAAKTKGTLVRKTAPSTGGVMPDGDDSPASMRSLTGKKMLARKSAPSTGGVRPETFDSLPSATAHLFNSKKKAAKSLSMVSDTSTQNAPTAKKNAEEGAQTTEKQENSRLKNDKVSGTEAELLLYGDCHDYTSFGWDGTGDEKPPARTIPRPGRRRSYKPVIRKSVKSTGGVRPLIQEVDESYDDVEEPEVGRSARNIRNLSDRESPAEDDEMEEKEARRQSRVEQSRKQARKQSTGGGIGSNDAEAESCDEEDEIPLLAESRHRYMLPKRSSGYDGIFANNAPKQAAKPSSSTKLPASKAFKPNAELEEEDEDEDKPSTPAAQPSSVMRGVKPSFAGAPGEGYSCPDCKARFSRSEHAKRHYNSVHGQVKAFGCKVCGKTFSRKDNRTQHMKVHRSAGATAPNKEDGGPENLDGEEENSSVEISSTQRRSVMEFGGDGSGDINRKMMNEPPDNGSVSMQESSPAKSSPPKSQAMNSTLSIRGGDAAASSTVTASRNTPATSFNWNFDLSKGRNKIAIMADFKDRAQRKRKAQDITQARLGDLEFRSRGLSITLPSRPASSAGGMTPRRRVAEEDAVDFLTLGMHQKIDPFALNSTKTRSGTDTPADLSRQSTPNDGADNLRRKFRRLGKRQSNAKDDSSSDKIEPLHHIDMNNVKKKKLCDKCKGLLLIKDAKGKTISAVEVVDSKTGERQQICKFCNDKEKVAENKENAKKTGNNVCCLCQRVETLKWHQCLPGELGPAGGGVFCHRCWDRDYKAKRKGVEEVHGVTPAEGEEASTKACQNACSLCKSTDSETWHSYLDGQPSAIDGTMFCKQCYDKDYNGKRASGGTKGICCLCNSTDSHVWHQRLYNKMPAGNGRIFCSKCYQKDYKGKRKLGRGAAMPAEKICCLCEKKQTTQWHKRLHKGEVAMGLLYCNACWQIDYREKMKKEKEAATDGTAKSKKRPRELSPEKPSFENQFAEHPSSEPAVTSDDLAIDLLHEPNNPLANIANSLSECKLKCERGLPCNPLPSSPQKASPSRRARERRKIEEEMMENWQPKEKIAGWEKYDLGDRWRALEAHHMETNPRDSEVPRVVRWSPCGRVVVAVGDGGVVSVYTRP